MYGWRPSGTRTLISVGRRVYHVTIFTRDNPVEGLHQTFTSGASLSQHVIVTNTVVNEIKELYKPREAQHLSTGLGKLRCTGWKNITLNFEGNLGRIQLLETVGGNITSRPQLWRLGVITHRRIKMRRLCFIYYAPAFVPGACLLRMTMRITKFIIIPF